MVAKLAKNTDSTRPKIRRGFQSDGGVAVACGGSIKDRSRPDATDVFAKIRGRAAGPAPLFSSENAGYFR